MLRFTSSNTRSSKEALRTLALENRLPKAMDVVGKEAQ
jgi:hypothetical protein